MRCAQGILMAFILSCACLAQADVPKLINYQGRLMDSNGVAILDGSYNLTFRLYTQTGTQVGNPSPWSETQLVAIKNGYFNVVLGSINPFTNVTCTVDFNAPYLLGIQVQSDPEMTPRVPLNSTPYSLASNFAYQVMTPMAISGAEIVTDYSPGYFYVLLTQTPREMTLTLHLHNFPAMFYREIAQHTHGVSASGNVSTVSPAHSHNLLMNNGYGGGSQPWGFDAIEGGSTWRGGWLDSTAITHDHTYSFTVASGASGGTLAGVPAFTTTYTGKTTLSNLRILLNGTDITSQVLSRAGQAGPIAGTMALKANILSLSPNPWVFNGENTFQLSQTAAGGGKVRYNLYVWY